MRRGRRIRAAACLAYAGSLALLAITAVAQAPTDRAVLSLEPLVKKGVTPPPPAPPATFVPGAGPFRLGMSLDETRAAAPQVAWRNVMVSSFTGRVFSMRSEDRVTIAGVEFEVEALAHYYQHGLRLEGAKQVQDAVACERAGIEVLTAIEAQAGPFSSNRPRTRPGTSGTGLSWQTQRSANGAISVVPVPSYTGGSPGRTEGETVSFGEGSTALIDAFDDQYRPRPRQKRLGSLPAFFELRAFNRGPHYEVNAEVDYGGDSGFNCAVRLQLIGWTQPPLPQTIDASQAKFAHTPTIAERHWVHASLVPGGLQPIDAELSCEVERRSGWTFGCGVVRPDGISPVQEEAAQSLARLTVFDMTGLDRDDPQYMRGTVRVRIDPAAVRPTDFLVAARTPLADLEFTEQPDPEAARLVRPELASDDDPVVTVPLTCRVEADGSLICIDAEAAADPERTSVVRAAVRLAASAYRVAPELRNGEPSAGRVFDLTVEVLRPL